MTIILSAMRNSPQLTRVWVRTGDARTPLACVWKEAPTSVVEFTAQPSPEDDMGTGSHRADSCHSVGANGLWIANNRVKRSKDRRPDFAALWRAPIHHLFFPTLVSSQYTSDADKQEKPWPCITPKNSMPLLPANSSPKF
jgi:hypothetical protein